MVQATNLYQYPLTLCWLHTDVANNTKFLLGGLSHWDDREKLGLGLVMHWIVCLFQVIIQHQEVEQELAGKLERVESLQQSLTEKLSVAQHQLSSLQMEKHDVEKSASRLEKDKTALIKTLDKVGAITAV